MVYASRVAHARDEGILDVANHAQWLMSPTPRLDFRGTHGFVDPVNERFGVYYAVGGFNRLYS